MSAMQHLSIVIPTYNRHARLVRAVDKIRQNARDIGEIIVVDGGSTDGTREWLAQQQDLKVILEEAREGAVRAFNKGFRAATGEFVCWLNDDAYPLPDALPAALEFLRDREQADVGMVALYHNDHELRNILDEVEHAGTRYHICHVRGYPYANFGLLRRTLLERVGYWDERFYFFGADPDLALTIQLDVGLKVLGCRDALIHHDEDHDERKLEDLPTGTADNDLLFAKWRLPEPGTYPDPCPGYQELLRTRGLLPV
jgi:GT2 family glycosyltransferase